MKFIEKLKTIVAWARRGMHVLPLKPKSKKPIRKGGVHNATTDVKDIKQYFRKHRDANYGIATGKVSNLLVVDIDGAVGKKSLHKLTTMNGKLPKTVKVKTGKGHHYYFRPGDVPVRNSAGRLGEGIDIRGNGGYVVGPGSVHASGSRYKFVAGRGPKDIEIAGAPRWLLKTIAANEGSKETPFWPVPLAKIDRAKAYMASAMRQELGRLGKAPKHQRNDTLNRCAFKLGQLLPYGLLDRANVARDLTQVAKDIGLEYVEISPTIKSGLVAGAKYPRSLPFLPSKQGQPDAAALSSTVTMDMTETLAKFGETDTDNAQRLAARYANKIVYTKGRGWLVYKQGRWLPDAVTECIEFAKDTARHIADETKHLVTDEAKAARAGFAKASLSKGALDRMVDLTKGLVTVEDSQLDADPWLFNTANGTIDLRTGYIEKHDPSDLLTQFAPVVSDRRAKCPVFKTFLKRITNNDKKLMRYMQKCVGYTLTGQTGEQVFFFCYGKSGSNGKSTFINLIRDMLGDYGRHTPTESLMTKQYDNAIPNDMARLAGVRMVTAVEANFNRHLDEAKLKAMTGGDPITARFMRQEHFTFVPTFKLWMGANDRPRVRGTDTALWRRIRVIPFNVQIPEAECDKDLPAKLKAEFPGILAWAVRGCLAWQRKGLKEPASVGQAGNEWAQAADHVKRFVGEVLTSDPTNKIAALSMYEHYTQWCTRNGETPLDMTKLKDSLAISHNIKHKRSNRGSEWVGVKFLTK